MDIPKAPSAGRLFPELREWMTSRGLLQRELADLLGVSDPTISQYLAGNLPFPIAHVLRLSLLTDIPAERFVIDRETARLLKLWGERSRPDDPEVKESPSVA